MKFDIAEFYRCGHCKVEKSVDLFSRSSKTKNGLKNWCKDCVSADAKKRRLDNHAEHLRRGAEARIRNREKDTKAKRRWREKNREYHKIASRKWIENNPERARAKTRNYRASKRAAGGRHTHADIQFLFSMQKGKCACCFQSIEKYYEVDHINPVKLGGSNDRDNLQLLCRKCNRRKSCKPPHEFAKEFGRLL